MKLKLIITTILFTSLFLQGCKSEGTISTSPSSSNVASGEENEILDEVAEEVVEEAVEEEEIEAKILSADEAKGVKFSIKFGHCINKDGEKVLIETDEFKNCADFSYKNLELVNLIKRSLSIMVLV